MQTYVNIAAHGIRIRADFVRRLNQVFRLFFADAAKLNIQIDVKLITALGIHTQSHNR